MAKSQILIVDDSKEILAHLAQELKDEPYTVLLARNGREALEIVTAQQVKVIISAVKMSGMDGFALLDQVKQLCPQMIRVILSGHPDVELILRMVNERGVDRYLTKPWHGEGLKAIIQQCLELFDLRAEVQELRTLLQGKALRQETSPWVLSQRVQTTGRQLRPR